MNADVAQEMSSLMSGCIYLSNKLLMCGEINKLLCSEFRTSSSYAILMMIFNLPLSAGVHRLKLC